MLTTYTSTAILEGIARETDPDAWPRFYRRYAPVLLDFARHAGLREHHAEEVVQETLLAFVQGFRAGQYKREKGRLQNWLKGIARNKVKEKYKHSLAGREKQVVDPPSGPGYWGQVPTDSHLAAEFDRAWKEGVLEECLDEVQRKVAKQTYEAFRLFAIEEWPAEKVAAHLGISRNAVYISKNRVLTRLRKIRQDMTKIW